MGTPLISVVVPCYNVAGYVAGTLESILNQTLRDREVLVVDDGSTDGTEDVLAGYVDRIRYFRIPNSGGPSRPRNLGLAEARGTYVSFCDADDLMLPGKLAAAAAVFAGHPEADFLFTNFRSVDESGTVLAPDFLAEYREFRSRLVPTDRPGLGLLEGPEAHSALLRASFVGTSSVVARTAVLRAAGGFDETMRNSEDVDLWRRVARGGATFAFLDEVHHSYRIRPGSISHGESALYPGLIRGYEKEAPHLTRPEDRAYVARKINRLWLGYGYALRREGRRAEARRAYLTALRQRPSWLGLKGLALCY